MAVHQPWRVALAWLVAAFGPNVSIWPRAARRFLDGYGQRGQAVLQLMERNINCPLASSAGRLFDAVAALLGICKEAAYEAQAAMALEAAAASCGRSVSPAPFEIALQPGPAGEEMLIIDPRPCLRELIAGIEAGRHPSEAAMAFHLGFAQALCDAAQAAARRIGLQEVVLSGGTFQNRIILERLISLLREAGLEPIYHKNLSPNDSSLCVGQAAVAAARLARDGASAPAAAQIFGVCGRW